MKEAMLNYKNKYKKFGRIYYVIQLLNISILFFLIYFAYSTWNKNSTHEHWAKILSILSLLLLLYHLIVFRPLKYKIWEFRTWFIIMTYIFMFGRVYLHGFNYDDNLYWNLSLRFPKHAMYQAGLVILCSIQALFIGFTINTYKFENMKKSFLSFDKYNKSEVNSILYNTGLFLFLITFPFRLFEDLSSIIETQTEKTYSALTSSVGLTDDIASLFVPAIIYMYVGLHIRKKYKICNILMFAVILYYTIIMILTGDRRYQTTAIISLILCHIYLNKVKVKNIIIFAIFSIVFLDLLTTISSIRLGGLTSLSDFIVYFFQKNREHGIIYSTLSGFGLTFFSVAGIVQVIPNSLPYQMGFSFYGAIPSLLPIGWLYGDFFNSVSISNVVNSIIGFPVGASLIGDSYANFGIFSSLFIIVFARMLTRFFYIESDYNGDGLSVAKYYSLFYIAINLVRGSFFESFRGFLSTLIIPIIIMKILIDFKKKNNSLRCGGQI